MINNVYSSNQKPTIVSQQCCQLVNEGGLTTLWCRHPWGKNRRVWSIRGLWGVTINIWRPQLSWLYSTTLSDVVRNTRQLQAGLRVIIKLRYLVNLKLIEEVWLRAFSRVSYPLKLVYRTELVAKQPSQAYFLKDPVCNMSLHNKACNRIRQRSSLALANIITVNVITL